MRCATVMGFLPAGVSQATDLCSLGGIMQRILNRCNCSDGSSSSARGEDLVDYLGGFFGIFDLTRFNACRDDYRIVAARPECVADEEHFLRCKAEMLRHPSDAARLVHAQRGDVYRRPA